jgi:hypothetical protein
VTHATANLIRAREAFVYGVRRRALRLALLDGLPEANARRALTQALAHFLRESRELAPARWPTRWWALLCAQLEGSGPRACFGAAATQPWQGVWDALPLVQRRCFLLRVWLRLDPAEAAAALGVSPGAGDRALALASRQLREALPPPQAASTAWIGGLLDALEHAPLGATDAPPPAFALPAAAAPPRRPRAALVLAALLGVGLLGGGLWLSWPRFETLPTDVALPEGASGLERSRSQPLRVDTDIALLLDPDWPLWAEPEQAEAIAELELLAWLESQDAP